MVTGSWEITLLKYWFFTNFKREYFLFEKHCSSLVFWRWKCTYLTAIFYHYINNLFLVFAEMGPQKWNKKTNYCFMGPYGLKSWFIKKQMFHTDSAVYKHIVLPINIYGDTFLEQIVNATNILNLLKLRNHLVLLPPF